MFNEYKVNESVEVKTNKFLTVVESEGCAGCFFEKLCRVMNKRNWVLCIFGECSAKGRKDGKDIIFKE